MQELIAEDFSTDEEPESAEEDMADDREETEMEAWEREGAQPRSVEDMRQDIRRTPPLQRTEVRSRAVLAQSRKKSPPTCKSHIEQPSIPQPTPPPATA